MSDQPAQRPQIKSLSSQRQTIQAGSENENVWDPPPLSSVDDTGLNLLSIADLVLKVLYYGGVMTGLEIGATVKLPFQGVLDPVVEFLKREKYVEVRGSTGFSEFRVPLHHHRERLG